jgi:biotin carboxyl carrier protein
MKYKVTLHGKTYEVEVEKGNAILLDEYEAKAPQKAVSSAPVQPAPAEATSASVQPAPSETPPAPVQTGAGNAVTSPLPGTITSVNVSQGQNVKRGQLLVTIESMKMENEILAPSDGTVTSVSAVSGQSVSTGAVLLTIA